MKQLVISVISVLVMCVALTAAEPQSGVSQFGYLQFCDGKQIQSVLITDRKRFAGHCRCGITVTPARELAFAFSLTAPASFDASPLTVFDIVTISDDGVTMIFESPLVGTIRVTNPQWTSTQALVINLKRFKIERNASAIWFVFQEGDVDWADNYMRSLKEFVD